MGDSVEVETVQIQIARLAAQSAAEYAALPTIEHLCVESPLYDAIEVKHRKYLTELRRESIQFDAFCVGCERNSTFKTTRSTGSGAGMPVDKEWMLKPGYIDVARTCQRNSIHVYLFCFNYDGARLTKYGQIPSLEDIAGELIRKYKSVLRDGYFDELKRATGLASHGIGIGSFVYLRRIFEKLIWDHHNTQVANAGEIEGFAGLRMEEKIGALKAVLPEALVENKAAYSILSKGIHELSEQECRLYFPIVRAAIILILEDDFQKRERLKAAQNVRDEVARIAGLVNSKAKGP